MRSEAPVIRMLSAADASAYRQLRLRALLENPQAFTSDAQEEQAQPLSWSTRRLAADPAKPHDFFLGAFVQGELAGMVGLQGRYRLKERHNATVVGMYVMPMFAGRGLGAELLQALLVRARGLVELEQLDLSVTQGNDKPQALYARHGFVVFGAHPEAIRVNGAYFTKVLMRLSLRSAAKQVDQPV